MIDRPRYLVTTADERTWKYDQPVIFLGEWCRDYDRKEVWSKMDAIVAAPYGLAQGQKDHDDELARTIEAELLLNLVDELNRFHGVSCSYRYWQIILGHWLRRYVNVIYNRYHTIKQCINNYSISGTSLLVSEDYHLATVDSLSFIYACNDDVWNNCLGVRVLGYLDNVDFTIDCISLQNIPGFWMPTDNRNNSVLENIKRLPYLAWDSFSNLLVRDHDAFIINSYLPPLEELKLHLELGQVPKRWITPPVKKVALPDRVLRKDLSQRISLSGHQGFRKCVNDLIFELLPTCYLEGFADLNAQSHALPWPERPQFIFTSNNFDTDEIFKCWTAAKAEEKIPYFTGQHGNYGVSRYHINPSIEEVTSDKFLTWGWTDGLPQHTPAFIFKTAGRKLEKFDQVGGLLLIEFLFLHRILIWDFCAEFQSYFDEQQLFIKMLDVEIKNKLTVRLHAASKKRNWREESRWHDFDSTLNLDFGSIPIRDLIAKSRLVVHSYDSTGILETLSQNIPTLAFWQNSLSHLRDSVKPDYQLLIDAGIVHLSSESLAKKVNEIWADVYGWWHSDQVQLARKQFCDRYARTTHQPVKDLKKILTQ